MRKEKVVKETAETKGADEKVVILQAEVVCRASSGRPAFAKLDLASVGVTKEQFSGTK